MKTLATLALGWLLAAAASAQPAQSWEPYSASLQSRATAGDAPAQFALGEAYRTGNGTAPNREQAIAWYRKAAAADPRAADALGVLLFTKGERKQAIPLLQAGASRRNPYALYILGTARFNGDYVPKDLARAFADMRIAAATLPQAQRSLGLMTPYITPDDRQRADILAAQPGGPEAGAPAAPAYATAAPAKAAPPVPRAVVASPRTASVVPQPAVVIPPDEPVSRPASPTPSRPRTAMPAPAVVRSTVPAGAWKVQLGAYGSEARAGTQWNVLVAKIPVLSALQRVTEPSGSLVRLQAAGLATRDDAAALCQSIIDTGAACFVVGPS